MKILEDVFKEIDDRSIIKTSDGGISDKYDTEIKKKMYKTISSYIFYILFSKANSSFCISCF